MRRSRHGSWGDVTMTACGSKNGVAGDPFFKWCVVKPTHGWWKMWKGRRSKAGSFCDPVNREKPDFQDVAGQDDLTNSPKSPNVRPKCPSAAPTVSHHASPDEQQTETWWNDSWFTYFPYLPIYRAPIFLGAWIHHCSAKSATYTLICPPIHPTCRGWDILEIDVGRYTCYVALNRHWLDIN